MTVSASRLFAAASTHHRPGRAHLLMRKYTIHVHAFTAQAAHIASVPVPANSYEDPAVDDVQDPTRLTIYTPTGTAAALRIAQRHLDLIHARIAYTHPGAITRTAADIVYAEARTRAESLTPGQRKDESYHALHSEDDALRMQALTDVMHERAELDT
ncbi:hypothetical protein ACPXCO_23065 [Streptomyces cyaneofuscatus]|uniref:hypothetical protein n=1 Tax=Streptomyces cyaneofuscatus TaxID=66883 RepID=UPI003CF9178F